MKIKSMVHTYTTSDLSFLIGDFEVEPRKSTVTLQIQSKWPSPIKAVFPMVTSSHSNAATQFQAQINYHANANFWPSFHKKIFIGFFCTCWKDIQHRILMGCQINEILLFLIEVLYLFRLEDRKSEIYRKILIETIIIEKIL